MNPTCIFCRMVAGELSTDVVLEDETCLAFLDIHPVQPGHLLVIPKRHVDHFSDLLDDEAAHLVVVAQRLSRLLRAELAPRRVALVVTGFGVPHAHLHVIPMHGEHDVTSSKYARVVDGQMRFGLENAPLAHPGDRARVAEQIRTALQR